jgi:hypothetical protein
MVHFGLHTQAGTRHAAPKPAGNAQDPQDCGVDVSAPLCQGRAMLGECQEQFSLTPRRAQDMRARQKQFPVNTDDYLGERSADE